MLRVKKWAAGGGKTRNLAEPYSPVPEREVTDKIPAPREEPGHLVLVIDDERIFQLAMKQCLIGSGWDYAGAPDGKSGLAQARVLKPSAILLDVNMPGMDGRDVLRELKEDPDLREIPVVIVTARNDEYTRSTSLELGAYEVVFKPFDPESLVRRIRWIVEKVES